jgi:hypothetical protein
MGLDLGAVGSGTGSGVAAAMAMTGMRRVTTDLGLVKEPPPRAILRQKVPAMFGMISPKHHESAIEITHWAYGGLCGGAFGFVPQGLRRHRWAGPAYGLLIWAAFEGLLAPALGLEQARQERPMERLMFALDHVLYGVLVARAH